MPLCLILLLLGMVGFSQAKSIKVGLDADVSAVAAEGGVAIMRGALIAINEINEKGGVLGKKLELVVKDHRGNPARGVDNLLEFAQMQDIVAVLSGVHTPVVMHELATIHEQQLPFLVPWAAGTKIIDNDYKPNFVFRLSVRDEYAGEFLVNQAKTRGCSRLALLLERTPWGRSNALSMTKAIEASGLILATTQWFNWGITDIDDQLQNIIDSRADGLLLVANAPEGVVIIKSIADLNEKEVLPVFSHWGIISGKFSGTVGLDALARVELSVLQTHSFLNSAKLKNANIVKSYNRLFLSQETPESIPSAVGVAHAYDLIHILAKAIELAKSTDRIKVRDKLEQVTNYDGLLKFYHRPFADDRHEALTIDDLTIGKFNRQGFLIPLNNNQQSP